jgi:hypothetical protein
MMNRYVYSVTHQIGDWMLVIIIILVGYTIERALVAKHGLAWFPAGAVIVWILAELYWSVRDLARRRTA